MPDPPLQRRPYLYQSMESLHHRKRRTRGSLFSAMRWLVKLYVVGLLLSLLSAFFGLMGFLGELVPLPRLAGGGSQRSPPRPWPEERS